MRQPKKLADLLKKLQENQQKEQLRWHVREQTRTQSFLAKHRLAYEKLTTKQERAVFLAVYVRKLRQMKQSYICKHKQLVSRQTLQRENLLMNHINPSEMSRQKRMKYARSILEAATKSGSLLYIGLN